MEREVHACTASSNGQVCLGNQAAIRHFLKQLKVELKVTSFQTWRTKVLCMRKVNGCGLAHQPDQQGTAHCAIHNCMKLKTMKILF